MTMIAIRYEKVKEINGYFYWTYRMRKYGYKIKPIIKLKNLTQRIYCDLEKSVAITFAEGGVLCDMIRCDYYLRLGVK